MSHDKSIDPEPPGMNNSKDSVRENVGTGFMYKHILIPTDGSTLSEKTITHGINLASEFGASVTVVTVTHPFHSMAGEPEMVVTMPDDYKEFVHRYLTSETEASLAFADTAAHDAGIECETVSVEHEHPYQAIIDCAGERNCDLIVMASHGRRGIAAMVLGSETTKVLTHSKIPVLVYR